MIKLNEVTEEKYFSIKPQYGSNTNDEPRNYKYYIGYIKLIRLIRYILNFTLFILRFIYG